MKKLRIFLHIILIASLVSGIFCFFKVATDGKEYMSKEEQSAAFDQEFYNQASDVLQYAGKAAEFKDQYGDDDAEVPETGKTVGELKKEYDLDNSVLDSYNEILDELVYNTWEWDDSTEAAVTEYQAESEYQAAKKKYRSICRFLESYRELSDSAYMVLTNGNFEYLISYTDSGTPFRLASENADKILKNREKYQALFLFDRVNGAALMENLDKIDAQFDSLVYQCDTFTDYSDFYAIFSVDSDYGIDDTFAYLSNEVVTDPEQIAGYAVTIAVLVVSAAALLISLFALTAITGKSGDRSDRNVKTYLIDTWWWDIAGLFLAGLCLCGLFAWKLNFPDFFPRDNNSSLILMTVCLSAAAYLIAVYYLSIVRRFKSRTFLKTGCIGILILKAAECVKKLWAHTGATVKAAVCVALAFFYVVLLAFMFWEGGEGSWLMMISGFLVAALGIAAVFIIVWKFNREYDDIAGAIQKIADGNLNDTENVSAVFKQNKKTAEAVRNIRQGVNKIVEENVKNERLKSDLITNVSHDIKTPLTSIINYVGLLKAEKTDNPAVQNYIRVLDEKSQRLKILTDDLVEASKLSSGAVEFHMEKLNMSELIKQSVGEYKEKFKEKNLSLILNLPENDVFARADGRKMWRVLENLYSNIYKYALEGTRVYIDLSVSDEKIRLSVKNISGSPLNVAPDELTERFVRGDESRSAQGSGLGLSIAKSIIERHNGTFEITLDGDLFKVVITLDSDNQ